MTSPENAIKPNHVSSGRVKQNSHLSSTEEVEISPDKDNNSRDIAIEACRRTSVHGIAQILAMSRINLKLFWTGVVLASFGK